jgi:DtxR family Mn-dependent transcriptional regulator
MGLVKYVRREYVTLTDEGEREARRVDARHRLLTRFLGQVLDMPVGAAERDACVMEHNLSDDAMDRMVRFFEFLTACPNSTPGFLARFHSCSRVHAEVPDCPCHCEANDASEATDEGEAMSVYDLQPGQGGNVTQVQAQGAIRQRLLDMGILPEARIDVERVAPTGEPIWIRLHGTQIALRRREAQAVLVVKG